MLISISGKVSDLFAMTVFNDNGEVVINYDGYVPSGIGLGSGDYIELTIDTVTGQIQNWRSDNDDRVKQFVIAETNRRRKVKT